MTLKAPKPTHLLTSLGLSGALLFTPGIAVSSPGHDHKHDHVPAHAASAAKSNAKKHSADAKSATLNLINEHREWALSRGNGKKVGLRRLVEQAQARQAMMAELIKNDPDAAIRIAVPAHKQATLPADVQAYMEADAETEGTLEVFFVDADHTGEHHERIFLKTDAGERFELHRNGNNEGFQYGQRVKAKGLMVKRGDDEVDGVMAVSADNTGLITLAQDGTNTVDGNEVLPALANTIGDQRTLVMLVNFQDKATQPWTKDYVNNVVFNEGDTFMRENSMNQTWLSGDVTNWMTLPISSTSCQVSSIGDAARTAAQNAGYNVNNYDRLIYAFPYTSACKWSGLGSVGGLPTHSWINGSMRWSTIVHELGHNFGLYHGHAKECGSSIDGDSCTSIEYGDSVDVMGNAKAHYTTFQKELLGWLDSSQIQTVSGSGQYQIETYATASGNLPKSLKIHKSTDATTGDKTWYYLEYRRPTGLDLDLGYFMNTGDGVVVHTGSESTRNSSYLLDMTPNSQSVDWNDPTLTEGNTFNDDGAGLSVTTSWVANGTAAVNVSMGAATCTPAAPTLTVSPVQSAWLAAGSSATFTLNVKNNDSAECANNQFNLNTSKPTGWSASLSSTSVSLAPGASTSVNLNVTSATSAADGYYNVTTTASSGNLSDSVTATYVVDTPVSNTPPVAGNDTASTTAGSPVTIAVLNNDSDADGDALTVTSTSGVNGNATINSNGTITFTPAVGFSGTESFTYVVSDGNGGTDSANVSVSVAAGNTAPNASNDNASTNAGSAVTINVLANDTDADGDALSITATSGVNGSAQISNGKIVFTPANGFSGTETFTYYISDGNGGSDSANVSVQVYAVNSAPVAANDSASTAYETAVTINVLANDQDADGNTLTVTSTSGVNGTATINSNGTITFVPASGFSGTEVFTYYVSDGQGGSDSASVSVNVAAPVSNNTAPVAVDDYVEMSDKSVITFNVLGNDWDAENDTLTVTSATQGTKGSVSVSSNGNVTYSPARKFKSTDSFTYTIFDGEKYATATVTLQLTGSSGGPGNGKNK